HNLVRGLPTKCFENDHTSTACVKGKHHKASCKSKLVKSVSKPLHTLHMDLFGPTSKGIKREFSNARTPQHNGVAERRNRTLIEAARTMVLVNKSHNKTPYELLNGRTPAIGFLKPFGCHVVILNTLDNLGKFEAKGMKVILLDTLLDAGANSTNLSGTNDAASQEVKKDVSSLRYIALPNWIHDALLESSSSKPQDDCSTDVPESTGISNPTATSTNPPADQLETLTVETPIPTVSSPVLTACFTNSLEPSGDTRLISKRVANQVETPSLDNILTLTNRFENILGVTSNSVDLDGVEADIFDALQDPSWVEAMQEEHLQFKIQYIWTLVDCPKGGKDGTGKDVDLYLYRSMIGSLMYLTASRPDIVFAICACARHQVTPEECHLHAVKRIFRYLKGHPKLGLWYPKESPFDLVAYSDSDYGGATQDRKNQLLEGVSF
nr:ribonuclease H-like domain, reverse transcriptase, RNA-dependent DNA polymerase [Tanacetum cinerariifolium]GFA24163.1 ribonuclease H-like domain, reverse transcriptase, RNA-dependent DNA polymerase [Tanacetum cinerariifolium]